MGKTRPIEPDEISDVLDDILAGADVLRKAHHNYANLTEDDLPPLDRYAAQLAGPLRLLAEEAIADAIARDQLPADAADRLKQFRHIDAAVFSYECREAAASCEAYGCYDPVEAIEKARLAGLRWLAVAGARVLAADPKFQQASALIRATRQAEQDAAEARLERVEAKRRRTHNAANMEQAARAMARWREARRIMGGTGVSPVKFVTARKPGWEELYRLYDPSDDSGRPSIATRKVMQRDWKAMKEDLLA
jgi:hypothetical protein